MLKIERRELLSCTRFDITLDGFYMTTCDTYADALEALETFKDYYDLA